GAELGANVIKTMMTANYGEVVRSCPVPVIVAGGEKNRDFFASLEDAAKAGAKGAAIGRNLFQEKERTGFLKKVREVFT
ncbi:MAG: hypothetical protein PHE22_12275, partial [Mesotoga sp.]|nr:hypothetical protein [Mesotoga sp.]